MLSVFVLLLSWQAVTLCLLGHYLPWSVLGEQYRHLVHSHHVYLMETGLKRQLGASYAAETACSMRMLSWCLAGWQVSRVGTCTGIVEQLLHVSHLHGGAAQLCQFLMFVLRALMDQHKFLPICACTLQYIDVLQKTAPTNVTITEDLLNSMDTNL